MGIYKEASYFGNDAFFEQLFKHEAYCVWNDEDLYDFMSESRESSWPEGCVSSGYGNLYFDFKPTYNGNMTYGLYTDQICKTEYTGSNYNVESVAKNMGLLYGSYLQMWNAGLEPYKVCQPCRAYNLQNQYSATGVYNSGSNYKNYQNKNYGNNNKNGNNNNNKNGNNNNNNNNGNRRLDGDYDAYSDPNDGFFQCADDAGYTNVNQCMKFRSHADLEAATWEDLVIATEQKGILPVTVGGTTFGTEKMSPQQQQYLKAMEEAKLRQEEAEYAALVASVPSASPILRAGSLMEWGGIVSLAVVLVWMMFRCVHDCAASRGSSRSSSERNYGTYKEPLNPNQVYNEEQATAQQGQDQQVPPQDQQEQVPPQDGGYDDDYAAYRQQDDQDPFESRPEWAETPAPSAFEQDMVQSEPQDDAVGDDGEPVMPQGTSA